MNPPELTRLAAEHDLDSQERFEVRVAFGIACLGRVERYLTDVEVGKVLNLGKRFVAGECSREELDAAAEQAAVLARQYAGSNSIDGTGSAAVSTSHGVAAALEGRALDAAEYAAYASVYGYSSHAASNPEAYRDEHAWQVSTLRGLLTA